MIRGVLQVTRFVGTNSWTVIVPGSMGDVDGIGDHAWIMTISSAQIRFVFANGKQHILQHGACFIPRHPELPKQPYNKLCVNIDMLPFYQPRKGETGGGVVLTLSVSGGPFIQSNE